jgi:hypothetical protein
VAVKLGTWSHEGYGRVIQFLWVKGISPVKMDCCVIEVYDDSIMSM